MPLCGVELGFGMDRAGYVQQLLRHAQARELTVGEICKQWPRRFSFLRCVLLSHLLDYRFDDGFYREKLQSTCSRIDGDLSSLSPAVGVIVVIHVHENV